VEKCEDKNVIFFFVYGVGRASSEERYTSPKKKEKNVRKCEDKNVFFFNGVGRADSEERYTD